MALRIQGKHSASKSELGIDPPPELQTTSVRPKSKTERGKNSEENESQFKMTHTFKCANAFRGMTLGKCSP